VTISIVEHDGLNFFNGGDYFSNEGGDKAGCFDDEKDGIQF